MLEAPCSFLNTIIMNFRILIILFLGILLSEYMLGQCPLTMTLSGTETGTEAYEASSITSTQVIEVSANVSYRGETSVTFLPGFNAKTGSNFHAFIGQCIGSNKTNSDGVSITGIQSEKSRSTLLKTTMSESLDEISLSVTPNPFHNATKLAFRLHQQSEIDLTIFDLNGRKVKQLATGNLEAGMHEFDWRADDLPPGVYLARLINGNEVKTVRIVLAR